MVNDEEKKAIKELTEIKELFEEDYEVTAILDQVDLESLVIALNLIEKQSKEIEELKEKNKFLNWYFENQKDNFVHKDKIKAKIEELEKELEDIELKNINKDEISKTTFYFIDRLRCKIKVLQSLLEKE